jgi:hypothetical protein
MLRHFSHSSRRPAHTCHPAASLEEDFAETMAWAVKYVAMAIASLTEFSELNPI